MRVKIHETMKQTFVNKQEASKKKARWKQNHKVDCFKKFTNHFANFICFVIQEGKLLSKEYYRTESFVSWYGTLWME